MTDRPPSEPAAIPATDPQIAALQAQDESLLPPPRSPSGQLVLDAEQHPETHAAWLRPFMTVDIWLGRGELTILILLTASMLVIGMLQIVLRDVFKTGLEWADVYLRHAVLWAGMLGATLTTQAGRHLCVDALIRLVHGWGHRAACILLDAVSATVCGILVTVSWIFVQQEMQAGGEALFWGLHRWQLQIIFPVAFALMTYRFLLAFLQGCAGCAPARGGGHGA